MLRYLRFKDYVAISAEYSTRYVTIYVCEVKNELEKPLPMQLTAEAIILQEDFENIDEANNWLMKEFKISGLDWKDYRPFSKDVRISYAFTDIISPMPQLISEKTNGELSVVVEQIAEGCFIHISGDKEGLKKLGKLLLLASDDYEFAFKLDKNWYKYLQGKGNNISLKIHNHSVNDDLKQYPIFAHKDVIEFSENCILSEDDYNL